MTEDPGSLPHEIPDHVAQYLARRALADLPASVYETLLSLTPEGLAVLEKVGGSLQEANCEPHQVAAMIH